MGPFLKTLRRGGADFAVEPTEAGFAIVRRSSGDPEAFNALAREAVNRSGVDFVALPRSDGQAGYDQVIILPIDEPSR